MVRGKTTTSPAGVGGPLNRVQPALAPRIDVGAGGTNRYRPTAAAPLLGGRSGRGGAGGPGRGEPYGGLGVAKPVWGYLEGNPGRRPKNRAWGRAVVAAAAAAPPPRPCGCKRRLLAASPGTISAVPWRVRQLRRCPWCWTPGVCIVMVVTSAVHLMRNGKELKPRGPSEVVQAAARLPRPGAGRAVEGPALRLETAIGWRKTGYKSASPTAAGPRARGLYGERRPWGGRCFSSWCGCGACRRTRSWQQVGRSRWSIGLQPYIALYSPI